MSIPNMTMFGEILNNIGVVWLYYTGEVKIGCLGQKLQVVYDTASTDLWVPSRSLCKPVVTDATYCKSHHTYNRKCSRSASTDGKTFNISYVSGSISGIVVTDYVTVADLKIKGQTFGEATSLDNDVMKFNFDGIFGLGLPGLAEIEGTPALFNLVEQGLIPQPVFALYFGSTTSELVLGGVDLDHYRGRFTFTPVTGNNFWLFPIDSIRVGLTSVLEKKFAATPDSGSSLIMGPPGIIDPITTAIGETADDGNIYVDCESKDFLPVVVFFISGKPFTLSGNDYIIVDQDEKDESKRCWAGFVSLEGAKLIVLGDIFMAKYYTQFDASNKRIGFAKAKKK